MIIRVTVNDNDFYSIMFGFMKNMWKFPQINKAVKDMSADEIETEVEKIFEHEKIVQLVNPNNDKKLTSEKTEILIDFLHKRFAEYLETVSKKDETKEYLKRNLKITIQKTFTDKWENGEAFYWLQHSSIVVNQ